MRIGRVGADFALEARQQVQRVQPVERRPEQVQIPPGQERKSTLAETARPIENRMESIFNPDFHRNVFEALRMMGSEFRPGSQSTRGAQAQRQAPFAPEPPTAPTSREGAIRDERVQGVRRGEEAGRARFERYVATSRELQQALAERRESLVEREAAFSEMQEPLVETARQLRQALAAGETAGTRGSMRALTLPTAPTRDAAVSSSTVSTDVAADDAGLRRIVANEIAREQAYVLTAEGRQTGLSASQREAIATHLSRFSVADLESVQDGGIEYAVVNPQSAPRGITWDMKEAAFYDPDRKTVYLSQYRLDGTVIHETAHALDSLKSAGGSQWSSETDRSLQQAFEAYRLRVRQDPSMDWNSEYQAYAATDIQEFTAEASRMFLQSDQTRSRLQALDPQTYRAIGAFLETATAA